MWRHDTSATTRYETNRTTCAITTTNPPEYMKMAEREKASPWPQTSVEFVVFESIQMKSPTGESAMASIWMRYRAAMMPSIESGEMLQSAMMVRAMHEVKDMRDEMRSEMRKPSQVRLVEGEGRGGKGWWLLVVGCG